MSALERAIAKVGGLSALAEAIKTTPQVVVNWRKRGVPAERVLEVEAATGGAVTRFELRPDIFGAPPRKKAVA